MQKLVVMLTLLGGLIWCDSAGACWRWRRCASCQDGSCSYLVSNQVFDQGSYAAPRTSNVAGQNFPLLDKISASDLQTLVEVALQIRRELKGDKTVPAPPVSPTPPTVTPAPPTTTTTTTASGSRDYSDDFKRLNDRLDRLTGDLANVTSAVQGTGQQVIVIRDKVSAVEDRLDQVEASLRKLSP